MVLFASARSATTRKAQVSEGWSTIWLTLWRSVISNSGSASCRRFASSAFRCSAASLVYCSSAASCSRTNVWLSVSRASRRRGFTSVSCSMEPVDRGTTNTLFCDTNVTAVSLRAQRGPASGVVVRVTWWRVRATVSMTTMSPASATTTRRRASSQAPVTGGASVRSASVSRRGEVVFCDST